MAAYQGDDSSEAQKKIQQITVDLESAREDLAETEYEKLISDQQQLLDTLYNEYELILNTRLDNIDYLLESVIDTINATAGVDGVITSALGSDGAIAIAISDNATSVKTTLETEAKNVGFTLSNAMNSIWSVGEGNAKSILTMYGDSFQKQQTTTNTVLNGIKADVNSMVSVLNKEATTKTNSSKTTTSSKNSSSASSSSTSNKSNTTNTSSSSSNITDDTLMGIASAIWVYGSASGWGNNPFRENKLTNKLGASNAKKVQNYINAYGSSGKLYNLWIQKGKNLDKYKYNAFKSGAKDIDLGQFAWTQENGAEFIIRPSDGAILTPIAKGDSVLNANASNNIWDMANSPAEFIKDNLNLGGANIPNNPNIQSNCVQNFDKIVFSMPNVKNYNDLLSEMQKDKNFERLVLSMTVDQMAGKSKLGKNKAIR